MDYNRFKSQHEEFYSLLKEIKHSKQGEELESYVYALLDIEESINKVYNVYIQDILSNKDNPERIKEKIWDIREEFRHIEYHITDAKLTE